MLNQLLETKAVRRRGMTGTMVSCVVHVVLIAAAIGVTRRPLVAFEQPAEVHVQYQRVDPKPLPERAMTANTVHTATPSPLGGPVLTTPVTIDVGIPPVDLGAAPTREEDWKGVGVPGGRPDGVLGATGPVQDDAPHMLFDVEKAAAVLPGSPTPAYPEMLKTSGVEGDAVVQFVVDTLGRAELDSFRVLQSTHDAFGASVRATLPRMRFVPAEAGGRKVRMLVQQRFAFSLTR